MPTGDVIAINLGIGEVSRDRRVAGVRERGALRDVQVPAWVYVERVTLPVGIEPRLRRPVGGKSREQERNE